MAEYIDIDGRVVVTDTRGRECETTVRHILEMNKGVYTAADVQPAVHAKWERFCGGIDWQCSNCNWSTRADIPRKYCPNCGADCRGTNNE